MKYELKQATEENIPALVSFYEVIGKEADDYFELLFEKDCVVLIAEEGQSIIACGVLNFEPKYSVYKKLEVPEIQDLNVHSEYRQQGIASAMIQAFENMTRDQGVEMIGISVGLTKEYGSAQRLYCKLGYIPDGNGVTCDRTFVPHGQMVRVEDDLCLMLLKEL